MRNLKRALSLTLASVMLLGMMVVGTSAASYPDVDSNDNVEAIEVLSAVGVIVGDNGNFKPDAPVTRNEMAVIMAKLILGTYAADSYVGTHPFTDVPSWADRYVAACYASGIIAGRSATTYDGASTVTAVEAAAMMLRALGYENLSKGATRWDQPVAAKANEISLFEGLNGSGNAPMNRDAVAKLALNSLKATMVTSTQTSADISIPGVVEIAGVMRYDDRTTTVYNYTNNDGKYDKDADGEDNKLQLCEFLYGTDLRLVSGDDDDFGRPGDNKWTYKGDDVHNTVKEASVVFTANTSKDDVLKAIKGLKFGANKDEVKNKDSVTTAAVTVDTLSIANGGNIVDAVKALTADGKQIEIFATDKEVTKVVVVTYIVDTVKSITEKDGKTTYKFDKTNPSKYNDADNTNVVIDGSVAEDDVVTLAKANNKYYVYPTTKVSGNQTAIKVSDGTYTATIGGSQYVIGVAVTNVDTPDTTHYTNSKDAANYFVDKNGFIVMVKDLEKEADKYAMITDVKATADKTLGNKTGYKVEVRAVLADGTVTDYTLKTVLDDSNNLVASKKDSGITICAQTNLADKLQEKASDNLTGSTSGANPTGKLFAYSINDDGEMVLANVADASTSMTKDEKYAVALSGYDGETSATFSTTGKALFTENTVFVFWNIDEDGKITAEAPVTGTKDLSVDSLNGVAVIEASASAKGTANVVFLKGESSAKEESYVYIDADKYTTELDKDNKNIKVWDGIAADGSVVKVHVSNDTDTTSMKDGIYVYDTDGKLNTTAKVDVDDAEATGTPAKGEYYHMTANVSENLVLVGNTYVDKKDANVVSVDSDKKAELEDGAKILIVINKDDEKKIDTIFVYQEAPEAPEAPAPCEHTLTKTEAGDKTQVACNAKATKAYWECSKCQAKFQDENGTTAATDEWIADGEAGTKHTAATGTYVNQYVTAGTKWQHAVKCANGNHAADSTSWTDCTATGGGDDKCSVCQHDTTAAAPTT